MRLLRATDVCVSGRTYTGSDVHMSFGMYAVYTTFGKRIIDLFCHFFPASPNLNRRLYSCDSCLVSGLVRPSLDPGNNDC